MKKIEKIINQKAVKRQRHQPSKILSAYYLKTAKATRNFTLKIRTDLDFFNAMIMIESLKNKQLFESTYERERKELHDLWPTLSYQERNKLINLKINEAKKRSRFFLSEQGEVIWIAFFDRLMNALYDREMNIFDLEQYFNLYRDYQKRMVPITSYGLSPYSDGFIDITVLRRQTDQVLFYYDPLKALYLISLDQAQPVLTKIGLRKNYQKDPRDHETMIAVMDQFVRRDQIGLIDTLIASTLVSDPVKKALLKHRKRLK